MRILYAALCGFALDLLLGDPAWLTPIHPVVLMGRCIGALEKQRAGESVDLTEFADIYGRKKHD